MLLSSPLFSSPVTPLLPPSLPLFSTDTLAALFRSILPTHRAYLVSVAKKASPTEAIGNHGNLATSVNLNTPCYQGATFSPGVSAGSPIWFPLHTPPLQHIQQLSPYLGHIPPLLIIPLSSIFPLSQHPPQSDHPPSHHLPHQHNTEIYPVCTQ